MRILIEILYFFIDLVLIYFKLVINIKKGINELVLFCTFTYDNYLISLYDNYLISGLRCHLQQVQVSSIHVIFV